MSGGTLPRIAVLDSWTREHNIPVSVMFELTHRCNLTCFHCYVDADRNRPLSTAEVFSALDQLADAGTVFVTFTGGEIMLRPDLFEILAHARERHFAVRLFTNGTLVGEAAADKIAAIGPFDVGISVYGADAATHESVTRQPGSFERSVEALRLLNERGIMTHLKCVLMAENLDSRASVAALGKSLGAHVQFDPMLTPRNDGDSSVLAHAISDDELAEIVYAEEMSGDADESRAPCSAGHESATITPSGDVVPCVQWPAQLGNLREQSFDEIWHGPRATALRTLTLSKLTTCRSCPDLGTCSICLGLNYVETGDAAKPSPSVCRMARARKKGVVA